MELDFSSQHRTLYICDSGGSGRLLACPYRRGPQAARVPGISREEQKRLVVKLLGLHNSIKLDASFPASKNLFAAGRAVKSKRKLNSAFMQSLSCHYPVSSSIHGTTSQGFQAAGRWDVDLASSIGYLTLGRTQRRYGVKATATDTFIEVQKEFKDEHDYIKAGGSDLHFVRMQALKNLEQSKIADELEPLTGGEGILELVVIGCGPAGLALAAEAAKQGLSVGIIGPDLPFTNNYGVWEDEFAALGLENCIEHVWKDTAVYLEADHPISMGRAYGRVSRHLLREELLKRCAEAGVRYLNSKVEKIFKENEGGSLVSCGNGMLISCRLVTAASGAASGRFLNYESGGPGLSVQTAYGIEVEVEHSPYNPETMVFMDYRDYRGRDSQTENPDIEGPPTFLYVMPLSSTRVFFEETCLAARPAMPFDLLKKRLLTRLENMGIKFSHVYEEEWSYIPVGCSVPDTTQEHLGFGAAASMVHPATGYSVVRSLSEAPLYAAAIAAALRSEAQKTSVLKPMICARDAALKAWDALWPNERKRQRAFFLFGLELILQLDLDGTRMFFETFFQLPEWMWKGFLAARLSSIELVWFALATFIIAPNDLRYRLVRHLMVDPSGAYLLRTYTRI